MKKKRKNRKGKKTKSKKRKNLMFLYNLSKLGITQWSVTLPPQCLHSSLNLHASRHGARPYKLMAPLCGPCVAPMAVWEAAGTRGSRDPEAVLMYSGLHTL